MNNIIQHFPKCVWLIGFLTLALLCDWAAAEHEFEIRLMATGGRESEIEPCGCRSKQLGGIDREARLHQDFEKSEGPYLRVDAGGWLRTADYLNGQLNKLRVMKAEAANQIMHEMEFHAVNVGRDEDRLMREILSDKADEWPLVSTNLRKPKSGERLYAPYRVYEWPIAPGESETVKVGLIGVSHGSEFNTTLDRHLATAGGKKAANEPAVEAVRRAVKELLPKADLIFVMAEVAYPQMKELTRVEGVDLVIHSNPPGAGSLRSRPIKVSDGCWAVQVGYLGRYMSKIWVRGSLEEGVTKIQAFQIEIPSDSEKLDSISKILADTHAKLPKTTVQSQSLAPTRYSFVGARACKLCHSDIFDTWERTPHAFALTTLIEKNEHENPECIGCHVVGYNVDNGFRDARLHKHLGGVQCENCHGPGYDHYRHELRKRAAKMRGDNTPIPKPEGHRDLVKEVPKANCMTCHEKVEPDFDFHSKSLLVDHKSDTPDLIHDPSQNKEMHELIDADGKPKSWEALSE